MPRPMPLHHPATMKNVETVLKAMLRAVKDTESADTKTLLTVMLQSGIQSLRSIGSAENKKDDYDT